MTGPPGLANWGSQTALHGLTAGEAERLLARFGPNETTREEASRWRSLAAKLWSPVPWMLEATVVLEAAVGKWGEASVVAGLLAFNVAVATLQEGRAQNALALLRSRLTVRTRVLRDGTWQLLDARQLVPGDLVHVRMGDVVPADLNLLEGLVQIDQSTLTGEALPVDAQVGSSAYAGSVVVRGEATARVSATGSRTYYGRTAALVRTAHAESHLERAILGIVRSVVALDFVLAAVVVGVGVHAKVGTGELIEVVVVLLLASVPVALPATFTLASALGARQLADQGILTARLSAVEEAAGMDVLCTDKTGTITRNELQLTRLEPLGISEPELAALASCASEEATQDPLDLAILKRAKELGVASQLRRVAFTPFDPATKRSEAVVEAGGRRRRVVKGAPEWVAGLCLTTPANLTERVLALAGQGARVLAVASGEEGSALTLNGLLALTDPVRPDSGALVRSLKDQAVRVIMITGDALPTARAVAAELGLVGSACEAQALTATGLAPDCAVVAGVLPEDKFKLVRALQAEGHVVGMTGDGVNDAPALKQADVGVAVASATDVAKSAAALVLTEAGLPGVIQAVHLSRQTYQRMLTYALNATAKKIEVPVFLSVVFVTMRVFALTAMLMVLLLVANDFATMAITTDRVRASTRPDRWRVGQLVAGSVAVAGPFLVFSLTVFVVCRRVLGYDLAQLQSIAFVTLAFTTQATVYLVREPRRAWDSRPGTYLALVSIAAVASVSLLAAQGWFMARLDPRLIASILLAACLWALLVDQVKYAAFRRLGLHRPA